MKLIGLSGSLRRASCNTGLLRASQTLLPDGGHSLEILNIEAVPFYNADLVEMPQIVVDLLEKMATADAFVFACPEYNYSIAPALKNVIDWASKAPGNRIFEGKAVAIMGSGGHMGTSRAQYHLRQVCVYLNLHPLNKPEIFANSYGGSFNADGDLIDEKIKGTIGLQMKALIHWASILRA